MWTKVRVQYSAMGTGVRGWGLEGGEGDIIIIIVDVIITITSVNNP